MRFVDLVPRMRFPRHCPPSQPKEDRVQTHVAEELERISSSSVVENGDAWLQLQAALHGPSASLPLLLRHQATVVAQLLSAMESSPKGLGEASRRLLVAVARDLRQEFFESSFSATFKALVASVGVPNGSSLFLW
jgi:hypothetical protein